MNSAMLDYDDFDLEMACKTGLPLEDAVREATEMRGNDPKKFVRVRHVGRGEYAAVPISAEEVYAEWAGRMQQRLMRLYHRVSK
ncbi:MAG: hypothetical protein ABR907_00730 [Terracidiphilus sp.]|jgi:hypothetical protein